jgi:hypothetical protein
MKPIFCVLLRDDDDADRFWLRASTPEEARHLVALNVDDEAEDADLFDCVTDNAKAPPDGVIYRRYGGTIAITKR